jgi:FAD synthase
MEFMPLASKMTISTYRGMCFIKKRGESSIDAVVDFYLFEKPETLSGTSAIVYFHKFIREEKPFSTPEELAESNFK